MKHRADHQKETTPQNNHPDLSETSVSESQREAGEQSIGLLLEKISQEWRDAQERFQKTEDQDGIEMAKKIQLLCEALAILADPVLLQPSRQKAVKDMIVCEAGEASLLKLIHPGNAARTVLSIATYLNNSFQR